MSEYVEIGEVWGIRVNNKSNASWFDICVILGVDETTNNCIALSISSGKFITDFNYNGLPLASQMDGWERIL